jgi:three-Cys-motif partner protein
MDEKNFFDKQTPSSRIKAMIVSEYFPKYCRIIAKKHIPQVIRYIDLFAGPGIYNDNSESTPLLVAKKCHKDLFLRDKVKLVFNDNVHSEQLRSNFNKLFPEGSFKHKPHFGKSTVGDNEAIKTLIIEDTHIESRNEKVSLLFIDPFGYKGIETIVLSEFMKNWGNEIFLFVNTKRIHPALENEKFEPLMQDLFPTTLSQLKHDRRYKATVSERLSLIIDSIGQEYCNILDDEIFYTAFKFQEEDSDATSHFILHLTKHHRGFDLIKSIYNDFANCGTIFDGKSTYTFDAKALDSNAISMFDFDSMNVDALKREIFSTYTGKSIIAQDLFDQHHKQRPFSRNHYCKALRELVAEQKASSTFTDAVDHKVSVLISKYCHITFY